MLKLGKLTVQWRHYNPDVIRQINEDRLDSILDNFYFVPDQQHIVFVDNNDAFYGTTCMITIPSKDELPPITIVGTAGLHKMFGFDKRTQHYKVRYEQFNKEIGRKISLENALKKINLTKIERQHIWDDYNNRALNEITKIANKNHRRV